ncbi:MAG: siderophore-interacting protein [Nocardioidaceae bacterium]
MTALAAPPVVAWRFFDVQVAAVRRLSASFVRLTLTGPDLDGFANNGWDQRFKLVLPDAHGSYDALPRGTEWYAAWRLLPAERQNPIRTYTVRAVRSAVREVDVDLVLHGDGGPASRFASRATVGDPLVVLGPNAEYDAVHGGLEFRPPPGHVGPTLLVGDATAAPAMLCVLEQLPADAYGEALIEVPAAEDIGDVRTPVGFSVTWIVTQGRSSRLPVAVDDALARLGHGRRGGPEGPFLDPEDDELLWDVPDHARADGVYAWIAGESSMVSGLRRHLVADVGIDRRSVAFMGYWRAGRPGG